MFSLNLHRNSHAMKRKSATVHLINYTNGLKTDLKWKQVCMLLLILPSSIILLFYPFRFRLRFSNSVGVVLQGFFYLAYVEPLLLRLNSLFLPRFIYPKTNIPLYFIAFRYTNGRCDCQILHFRALHHLGLTNCYSK